MHTALTVSPPGFWHDILGLGWVGVDLFFVLSGYLITGILLDSSNARDYFRRFYLRRVFRILPIYYVFVILFFHVGPWIGHATGTLVSLTYGRSDEIWYWTYLSNWRDAVQQNRYLRHFWSLSIEEQFYLVWPMVVYVSTRARLKYICIGLAMSAPLFRYAAAQAGVSPYSLYGWTPFRFEGLALGGLLAAAVRDPFLYERIKRLMPLLAAGAAVVLTGVFISSGTGFTTRVMAVYGYSSVAVLGWAFVFHGIEQAGGAASLARFLRRPWLVSFGKYSYGLYVWHLPIAEQVRMAGEHALKRFGMSWTILVVPMLMLAIGGAYLIARLSWAMIEEPCARLKERFAA
jgi:peptidoglycan/LPS O-acetylase OafA/YrhL